MSEKKIVIVGAGIVGCSLAYFLTKKGQQNITVIEQGPMIESGGSTSHAPGLVFQINFSKVMTKLAEQTVQTFKAISTNDQPAFYSVGSISLANTPERLMELKRKAGVGKSWGIESKLLSPEECRDKFPLIDPDDILGGLYVPSDGAAKPLNALSRMIDYCTSKGVSFHFRTEVTNIRVDSGQVKAVETTCGTFNADMVVCSAGIWGPRIAEMAGVTLPLMPMAHQYTWTEDLTVFQNETEEITAPIIRHEDSALYYRQVFKCLGAGSYQHRSIPVEVNTLEKYEEAAEAPAIKTFTPEDFEKPWQDVLKLMPALNETKIKRGINGIFSFTPDNMPLLGESQKVKGFWVAEALWVTHSAGAAKEVAEWMINGAPELDLKSCDVNRFDTYALNPIYYKKRSIENYDLEYDIIHPLMPPKTGRNMRLTPFYIRQKTLKAFFDEKSGWESAQWYEANSPLVSEYEEKIVKHKGWSAQYWSPIAEAEQIHVGKFAGLFDLTASGKRLEVSGDEVLTFLQKLMTSDMNIKTGQVVHTLMLDHSARIIDEVEVIRKNKTTFLINCTGPVEAGWIKKQGSLFNHVSICDLTSGTCCLLLIGPTAKPVIEKFITFNGREKGFAQNMYIGPAYVTAIPDSYYGKDGWKFYTTLDQGLQLWDTLLKAGEGYRLIAAGSRALKGLRVSSFTPQMGSDFWSDYSPVGAGLPEWVNLQKEDFIGKKMLLDRKKTGSELSITRLEWNNPEFTLMGDEPVSAEGKTVGFVTSAGYSYETDKGVALALIETSSIEEGKSYNTEYFGETVQVSIVTSSVSITRNDRSRGGEKVGKNV
ncbi:FAD-dependent oxidoreductase [Sporolactobacillus sp. THM7-4]|nr:FAD-dependent oxidoreductase [Sporolactobacillus sp. THM7-4]